MNNLLVAEDDDNDYELLCQALKRFNYKIARAVNVSDCQRILRRTQKFRAAFIDLKLPGASDFTTLARWIKSNYPEIPIVVLSGDCAIREDVEKRQALFSAGALIVIVKPYTSLDNEAIFNLMDLTDAIYQKGLKRHSWRTTSCGAVTIGFGVWVGLTHDHAIGAALAVTGIGLLCSQDQAAGKFLARLASSKKEEI